MVFICIDQFVDTNQVLQNLNFNRPTFEFKFASAKAKISIKSILYIDKHAPLNQA